MKNQNEVWLPVKDYEGIYDVSDLGRVRRINTGRILKGGIDGHGYRAVTLSKNGITECIKVHRLVAMAFLNHKPCGYKIVVNHININKLDNRASNLELVTVRENTNRKHCVSSSKHTGVSWIKKRKKWLSQIVHKGSAIKLGVFKNEKIASAVYQSKLEEILKSK